MILRILFFVPEIIGGPVTVKATIALNDIGLSRGR